MAITISRDFEGGSYDATSTATYVTADNARVHLKPSRIFQSTWQHFAARLDGVGDQRPEFALDVRSRFWSPRTSIQMAMWTYDLHGDDWRAFDNLTVSSDGTTYTFRNNSAFTQGFVYVCHQSMFTMERWRRKVEGYFSRSYVSSPGIASETFILHRLPQRLDRLNRSIPSYPVYALRATDPTVTTPKIQVLIHGGQHVDERHHYWVLEGALDLLLSNDPKAVDLRKRCDFLIIPHCNPQAAHAGYVRTCIEDSNKDHNRYWGTDTSVADLQLLKSKYPRQIPDCQVLLDYHNLGNHSGDSKFQINPTDISKAYVAKANAYHPTVLYNPEGLPSTATAEPVTSPLPVTTTIRGWALRAFEYLWQGIHVSIEEVPLLAKTIEDRRRFGRATIWGLHDVILAGWVKPLGTTTTPPPSTNAAPTCSMQAPTSGASFAVGSTVTLAASASDTDGTVAGVKFYTGAGTLIGAATFDSASGWWKRSWSPASGSHTVYAVATDNDAATGKSANRTFSIAEAPVATTTYALTWGYTANANPASGFRVEESVNNGSWSMFAELGSAARSHSFGRPDDANKRRWRVLAYNSAGESPPSGIIGDGKV